MSGELLVRFPSKLGKISSTVGKISSKVGKISSKVGKISSKFGQISSEFGEISASSGCEFRRGWLIILLKWALSALSPVFYGASAGNELSSRDQIPQSKRL